MLPPPLPFSRPTAEAASDSVCNGSTAAGGMRWAGRERRGRAKTGRAAAADGSPVRKVLPQAGGPEHSCDLSREGNALYQCLDFSDALFSF